jgi:membrane-anchored protein YejM (alkaline phosphatase superfamily)
VSGNTVDAFTALQTGCLPFTKTGREAAFSRNLGTEFKRQGYQTASFSTTKISLQVGAWQMIQNYLTGNMDAVFDPTSEGHPLINGEGSDDLLFLPIFENWLQKDAGEKFYAQFFMFNTHFPYLKNKNSTASHPYYAGLESFDNALKTLFGILEKNERLNDTVVIVSGDHGEYVSDDGQLYARLNSYNPYILNPMTFMYIPEALFPSEQARETLKRNKDKVLSTLDLFPTIQHILYGGDVDATAERRSTAGAANLRQDEDHCVTGLDDGHRRAGRPFGNLLECGLGKQGR